MAPFSHWKCPLLFSYFKKWSFLPYVGSYYPFSFPYNFTLDVTPFSHWECPLFFPYFKKSLSFHTLALIPHCLSPLELYPLYIGHPKLHPPLYNPFSRNPLYTINPFTQTPTPYTTLQSPLSHDYPYTTKPSYNPHPIQPL